MNILRKVRNYIFYCGIEKDEYKELKRDAYVSNFVVWRAIHCLMTVMSAFLFIESLSVGIMSVNKWFYLALLVYSASLTVLFLFLLKKDSLIAQFLIYLSISMLFLFGILISSTHPELPATTFVVFLLVTPMFMIDKPYFMAIELCAASTVYLVWMYRVKSYEIWTVDLANIVIFVVVGIFMHIVSNSLRIREFVLTRKMNIQKDTDDLTGLRNKGALSREINSYLSDASKDKGLMLLMDLDRFKSVNDTYGHDVGDSVISQFGHLLNMTFRSGEIIGRFGGDEFIVFIKDTDSREIAEKRAREIVEGTSDHILVPDKNRKITVSVGIAVYNGEENNYSEIFKKADLALYKTKSDRTVRYSFYSDGLSSDSQT